MDDAHEMMVVEGINLDEHVKASCCIVTFNNLWNLSKALNHIVKICGILKEQTYVGACLITNLFGIDYKLRTFENAKVGELLNALMNSRSTDIADASHFKKRNSCIGSYEMQNFFV